MNITLPWPNDMILDGAYAERDPEDERRAIAHVRRFLGTTDAATDVLAALGLLNAATAPALTSQEVC